MTRASDNGGHMEQSQSTDVVVHQASTDVMVAPGPITEQEFHTLWRVANALAASRMFRDSRQAEQAFARILCGRDLGLSPTEAMTSIHIVEGKPEVSADLQASMLRTYRGPDGERYDFRVVTPTDKRDTECHIEIRRRERGEPWEVLGTETFTLDDARKAGLINKDVYKKYPRNMLFARAISNAIAFHAPEVAHAPRQVPAFEVPAHGASGAVPEPRLEPATIEVDGSSSDAPPPPEPVQGEVVDPDEPLITQAMHQHLRRLWSEMDDADREARFCEALDIVGSPEHEEIAQRVAQLKESQGAELLQMLSEPRRRREEASAR